MEALSYCQLMERCIALEAEVAELRGREVKIPRECVNKQAVCRMRSRSLSGNYRDGWNDCRDEVIESLVAAGNSPAIPDGYALVPVELTCEMDEAAWDAYHNTRAMSDIWSALLAAAPQQEAK